MKERLMVQRLINEFIEKDYVPPIAILTGIRRVGKTTLLKQLESKYKYSAYIEIKPDSDNMLDIVLEEISRGTTLILLDEITHCMGYDVVVQDIYNEVAKEKNVKVIMTGSSPYHLNGISYRKLGGGRSVLFKLPPLLFTEYLYFTDKISSYSDIKNIDNEWFGDYLQSKDLGQDLVITLDENYLNNWSRINEESNENSLNFIRTNTIKKDEILAISSLISYNIMTHTDWDLLRKPKIAKKEHMHIKELKIKNKFSSIDLTSLLITQSSNKVSNLNVRSVSKILLFLLESGLALAIISNPSLGLSDVKKALKNCKNSDDLDDIFLDIIIIMVSPLFYLTLGKEIFNAYNKSLDLLKSGIITGLLAEAYFASSITNNISDPFYTIYKLTDDNNINEVDIFSKNGMLLLESSLNDKKEGDINLEKYLIDKLCIRVCTSKIKEYKNKMYHVIPYGRVMCLTDTGEIYNLDRSCDTELLFKKEDNDVFKSSKEF